MLYRTLYSVSNAVHLMPFIFMSLRVLDKTTSLIRMKKEKKGKELK